MNSMKRTILILENEVINIEWLRLYFQNIGYDVIGSGKVSEAKKILTNNNHIVLVITEINLQKEDGFKLIKYIRNSNTLRTLPIVCTSSIIDDKIKKKLENIKCTMYLQKPYSANDILKKVKLRPLSRVVFSYTRNIISCQPIGHKRL